MSELSQSANLAAAGVADSGMRGLFPVPAVGQHPIGDQLSRAPRISGLSVDGFGALADVELVGIGEGLTVVLGPNEAGKSTLFDFVAAVLFGFPGRKADERFRPPLQGGRHGGRVGIIDPAGDSWVIERHASPKKRLAVTRPDGSPGDELDLHRLLGGANAELFRAVFAVDLDDLRRLEGMSSDEVREVLFSSSILGQRRSAARAMKELESARETLVKPRQGALANSLLEALRATRRELDDARHSSGRFRALVGEAERMHEEMLELRRQQDAARARARDYELLHRCWEVAGRINESETRLRQLAPLSETEKELLANESRFALLRAQFSGHVQRLISQREALAQHAKLADSIERRIRELGGPWAREVAHRPGFDPRRLRVELQELLEALQRAAVAREAAHRLVESERSRSSEVATTSEGAVASLPPESELRRRIVALRELRGLLTQIEQLSRDIERDAELEQRRQQESSSANLAPRLLSVVSVVAIVVLLAIAGILVLRHQGGLGAVVALLAVALAVLAGWSARSLHNQGVRAVPSHGRERGRSAASSALAALFQARISELAATKQRAEEAERTLGLALPVSLVSLQQAVDETELQADERRRLDHRLGLVRQVERQLKDAEQKLVAADEDYATTERAVADLAESHGLPRPSSGSSLMELVEGLADLRDHLDALGRVEESLPRAKEAIRNFEIAVLELAKSFRLEPAADEQRDGANATGLSEDVLEGLLSEMAITLDGLKQRAGDRLAAANAIAAANREIERTLGEGEHAVALRAELNTGRVLEWEAEAARVAGEIESLQARHEQTVRDHEGLSRQIDEITSSSDIPRLEQACLELEEQLREAMRSYLVASGARMLLARTLKHYEQQRQPVVLERAGVHFAKVTKERYVRLGIDSTDASKPSIRAIRPDGSFVDAADLSRGTMEQLYLCLRLGLAESFAERYVPLPVVLDDVLVNFDPERKEAVVKELASTARDHQVILLTCHPEIAQLVTRVAGKALERADAEIPTVGAQCRTIELTRI